MLRANDRARGETSIGAAALLFVTIFSVRGRLRLGFKLDAAITPKGLAMIVTIKKDRRRNNIKRGAFSPPVMMFTKIALWDNCRHNNKPKTPRT